MSRRKSLPCSDRSTQLRIYIYSFNKCLSLCMQILRENTVPTEPLKRTDTVKEVLTHYLDSLK